jgi:hypothetical protein
MPSHYCNKPHGGWKTGAASGQHIAGKGLSYLSFFVVLWLASNI